MKQLNKQKFDRREYSTEAFLGPCHISMIEFFFENSYRQNVVGKAPSELFDMVPNAPLITESKIY